MLALWVTICGIYRDTVAFDYEESLLSSALLEP